MGKHGWKQKRWLKIGLGLLLALLVILGTLPVWFPWVLQPLLRSYGLSFKNYDRLGYSAFELSQARLELTNLVITAEQLRLPLPSTWAWTKVLGATTQIQASGWKVQISLPSPSASNTQPPSSPSSGLPALFGQLDTIFKNLARWLPATTLTNGEVCVGAECLVLDHAVWKDGRFQGTVRYARIPQTVQLKANLARPGVYPVIIEIPAWSAVATNRLQQTRGAWELNSLLRWGTNAAQLQARFAGQSWLPASAQLHAPVIGLPASLLELPDGYPDPQASLTIQWQTNGFQVAARADVTEHSPFPPVEVDIRASGTRLEARLETLHIQSPWLAASLAEPISLNYQKGLQSGAARLRGQGDLSRIPFSPVAGQVAFDLGVEPRSQRTPLARFEINATNLVTGDYAFPEARMEGSVDWPIISLQKGLLLAPDQTRLAMEGQFDLNSKVFTNGLWALDGNVPFLPTNWIAEGLQATGRLWGPMDQLAYEASGRLRRIHPPAWTNFGVEFSLKGRASTLAEVRVLAQAQAIGLDVGLADVAWTNQSVHGELQILQIAQHQTPLYRLEAPARIRIDATAAEEVPWRLDLARLVLAGENRWVELQGVVQWPERGQVQLIATNFQPSLLSSILPGTNWNELRLDMLEARATWDRSPLQGTLSARASYGNEPALTARAAMIFTNDLRIDEAVLSGGVEPVLRLSGRLPLQLRPDQPTNFLHLDLEQPLELQAMSLSNQVFWAELLRRTGVRFTAPSVRLNLTGTLAAPKGHFEVVAEEASWQLSTNRPFAVDQLRLQADLAPESIRLESISVRMNDTPIRLHADLRIDRRFWEDTFAGRPLAHWQTWTGEAELADVDLAAISRMAPKILLPQGTLSANARLQRGDVNGTLRIEDASTAPLATLGALRGLTTEIDLTNSVARIRSFQADLSGQPIGLQGSAELTPAHLLFDLKLAGANVPLVRQSGLVVRADLDLTLRRSNAMPALLSGVVNLRDSLFLQDLKALRPGGLNEPTQRPPYFRVSQPPFSDWKLDVRIQGDEFLRAQTPLFHGQLSAALQLQGRLEDPLALGDLRIDRGLLFFPFASLNVSRGLVSLTQQNPYDPSLFVTAETRAYGYNLRVELSGTASQPVAVFSSTPPLSTEEIVVMLTTGELPSSDYTFSNEQRVSRLAMFIGRDLLAKFGSNDSEERLTVRSGEDFSDHGKLTYSLEYKLTENWSVVGEYDRFNALNAGLKWRIYSR